MERPHCPPTSELIMSPNDIPANDGTNRGESPQFDDITVHPAARDAVVQTPSNSEPLRVPCSPVGAYAIEDADRDLRDMVPCDFKHAKDLLRQAPIDNGTCKAVLKAFKVTGAQNAKVGTKLRLIAIKMTQRQFSLKTVLDLIDQVDRNGQEITTELQELRPTAAKIIRGIEEREEIAWLRGDIPVFEGDGVLIGKPDTVEVVAVPNVPQREPDFEAAEFCRLLHVLADARMTSARTLLMEPRTREELDAETQDPWAEQIAPHFNDVSFRPEKVQVVSGGVSLSDIASIDPSARPYEKPAGVLKRKFAEFKSLYGNCKANFESSGQGDPDLFVFYANGKTYIIYAFCFLKFYPILVPLATRALQSDAQREEGVKDGVSPTNGGDGSGRKRRKATQEISIVGIEGTSSALKPFSEDVARETEKAERDKAKFEATEAKGKSAQSILAAISQAKQMWATAETPAEQKLYQEMVSNLMLNLSNNFS